MARRKGLKQVDTVTYKGRSIPIMFDPNPDSLKFCAGAGGDVYSNERAEEVKAWARKYLQETHEVTWIPCIEVRSKPRDFHSTRGTTVNLYCRRFYYCVLPNGRMSESHGGGGAEDWGEPGKYESNFHPEQLHGKPFVLPYSTKAHYDEHVAYIPYDEQVWERLQYMTEMLAQVQQAITELLGSSNIAGVLLAGGLPQLQPGTMEEKDGSGN